MTLDNLKYYTTKLLNYLSSQLAKKVNKTGDTLSGTLNSSVQSNTALEANKGKVIINSTSPGYTMLSRLKSTNGVFTDGVNAGKRIFQYTSDTDVNANNNTVQHVVTLIDENGNTTFPGKVSAANFSGISTKSALVSVQNVSKDANTAVVTSSLIAEEYNSDGSTNLPENESYIIITACGNSNTKAVSMAISEENGNFWIRERNNGWKQWKKLSWSDVAGDNLGLVKTGGDVDISSDGTITVKDNSHNHTIDNISGLQSALNNKSPNDHTHNIYTNQNAFSNIKVNSTNLVASTATDTFNIVSGENVNIVSDPDNNRITISSRIPTTTITLTPEQDRLYSYTTAGFYVFNASLATATSPVDYPSGEEWNGFTMEVIEYGLPHNGVSNILQKLYVKSRTYSRLVNIGSTYDNSSWTLENPATVNNLAATESGSPLDATQGKVLNDKIDNVVGKMQMVQLFNGSLDVGGGVQTLNDNITQYRIIGFLCAGGDQYHHGTMFFGYNTNNKHTIPIGKGYISVISASSTQIEVLENTTGYALRQIWGNKVGN